RELALSRGLALSRELALSRYTAPLFDAVAPPFEAGRHCTLVGSTLAVGLLRRNTAVGLGGIKAGLALRPLVTLVLVARLILLRLAILRLDEAVPIGAGRRRGRIGGCSALVRWIHDLVLLAAVAPDIVRVIRVVVRHTSRPHCRVVRRQNRHKHADGCTNNYITTRAIRVPNTTRIPVAATRPGNDDALARQIAIINAARRVVMVVAETRIHVIPTRTRARAGALWTPPITRIGVSDTDCENAKRGPYNGRANRESKRLSHALYPVSFTSHYTHGLRGTR